MSLLHTLLFQFLQSIHLAGRTNLEDKFWAFCNFLQNFSQQNTFDICLVPSMFYAKLSEIGGHGIQFGCKEKEFIKFPSSATQLFRFFLFEPIYEQHGARNGVIKCGCLVWYSNFFWWIVWLKPWLSAWHRSRSPLPSTLGWLKVQFIVGRSAISPWGWIMKIYV